MSEGALMIGAVATTIQKSIAPRLGRDSGEAILASRSPDPTLARLFARFALTGLVAMIVIGAFGFILVRQSATDGALRQAEDLTQLAGRGIAEPLITPEVLRGNPAALARLDRAVHERILTGTPIVRVKVWDAHGRIVYSDAPHLIGSVYALGADEQRTLRSGGTEADASDLTRPENRSERAFKRLVEVYVGIPGPAGQRLLYEDYERSSTISASSRRQWMGLLPALIGALLVLYLIQVPLAYSLARRLRARQREREELLRRAIDASDLERRRIAADLHDSAVQRLAGISLSLAANASDGPQLADPEATRKAFAGAAAETRETIRELRTLLVDIYPPTLQRSGLAAALVDLVAPLRAGGITVSLEVADALELPPDTEALLYRVAQEALRNARTHGEATEVDIRVEEQTGQAVLRISDNGRGFSPDTADPHQPGHFGLRLMRDLADHAGGRLQVHSTPGAGASVRLEVPLP
jgi:two-component system NarL family sensor kinase